MAAVFAGISFDPRKAGSIPGRLALTPWNGVANVFVFRFSQPSFLGERIMAKKAKKAKKAARAGGKKKAKRKR